MADAERLQSLIGEGSIEEQLQRLGQTWDEYRTKGSGRNLGEEEARVLYAQARWVTGNQGWHIADTVPEIEREAVTGVTSEEFFSSQRELGHLSNREKAALERRLFHLVDVAKGRKKVKGEE